MKKTLAILGILTAVSLAHAQTTNLVPDGGFTNTVYPSPDWVEVSGGGTFVFSYPASGGNPGRYGVIDNPGGNGWGIWVAGDSIPLSLASLGLTAGHPANWVWDMRIESGSAASNIGGIKIDYFSGAALIGSTGDMRPSTAGKNLVAWETYSTNKIVPANADGVKVVPLWGPNSKVGFDNFRVIYTPAVPLTAEITSPANNAVRSTNFFVIDAIATVSPGTVTNVAFYDGATLLANYQSAPYQHVVISPTPGVHPLTVVAKASTGASVTSAVVNVTVSGSVAVKVDSTKSWLGFMNVWETPTNGGAYVFGSPWGTGDLRASFASGSLLTLSPNIINDPAPFYYVTTNSPSVGNKSMEANFYVEPTGSLPGQTVTFTGRVLVDSLIGLSNTNPAGHGWTAVAFIKDFASDYSTSVGVSVPLTNGVFYLELVTGDDPLRHVQYGFTVRGPCVWPTDPVLASYGNIQVSPVVPPTSITPSLVGGNLRLTFPTYSGLVYTVQSKTNITDASWNTLTTTNGTGAAAVVSTPATGGSRFFRLSVQ